MSLPLTIAGRSPFDPIRLRWGGGGTIVLGVVALAQGNAGGIIFGILLIGLGVGTWVVTGFGGTPWFALSSTQRGIAGPGAFLGLLFLYMFFGIFFLVIWVIKKATGS